MKIHVLGTRGEIEESAPYHSKKSGVLIDNKLLLDCGNKRFLDYRAKYVLITHLHPDHAYFVRRKEIPDRPDIQFYAPEPYPGLKIRSMRRKFTIDGYSITPIPIIHSAKVKSNAYLIEHKGKRILYTGDMIWLKKKYRGKIKDLDLVITEASFIRKGGMIRRSKITGEIYGHTGVPNLINLFKEYTNTILLVHFGAWFYQDMKKARQEITALQKEYGVQIVVGYDNLAFTI
jgi:ribonuclease BN (tRNA processing enzyme)